MNQVPKFCSNCGHPLELNDRFCGQCGHAVEKLENENSAETRSILQNTSGQGRSTAVPAEIKKWNWGAFFLNWLWGFGNRTYIALLCLIPLLNIVMIFVLGAKGSEWAWRNKQWESISHFKRVQKRWAWWGFSFFLLLVAVNVLVAIVNF